MWIGEINGGETIVKHICYHSLINFLLQTGIHSYRKPHTNKPIIVEVSSSGYTSKTLPHIVLVKYYQKKGTETLYKPED